MQSIFDRSEPDVPVAHIVSDSLLDGHPAPGSDRLLVFRAQSVEIELTVSATAAGVRVAVAVRPPGAFHVSYRTEAGVEREAASGPDGAVVLDDAPRGLASVRVDSPDLRARTAWVTF